MGRTSIGAANLIEEQTLIFNTIVEAVQTGLTCNNVERVLSEVTSFPNAHAYLLQAHNIEDVIQPRCKFLYAPGGTRRTCLINVVQNCLKGRGKNAVAVATSTVAAKLITGGRAARFIFDTLVPYGSKDTCYIFVNYNEA